MEIGEPQRKFYCEIENFLNEITFKFLGKKREEIFVSYSLPRPSNSM